MDKHMDRQTVIITGGGGFIGRGIVEAFAESHNVAILDLKEPEKAPPSALFAQVDLTSDDSVRDALDQVRAAFGARIACVFHLAAFIDLSGEPDPKYEAVTVRGTERLLRALRFFEVERFAFASTMLVHAAGRPGERITEDRPLDPKLPYRASKIETEQVIEAERGEIPVVHLRPAGVYDDLCRNVFLAHQIARIFERDPKAHAYPGDLATAQSFLHRDDLVRAALRVVERRSQLPPVLPLLIGEPEAMSYGELQAEIGRLIDGAPVETLRVPKALAKAGDWVEEEVIGRETFVRPWMVDVADDCYVLDVARARDLLGWSPERSLRDALPEMIGALKADPEGWYEANHLDPARIPEDRRRR